MHVQIDFKIYMTEILPLRFEIILDFLGKVPLRIFHKQWQCMIMKIPCFVSVSDFGLFQHRVQIFQIFENEGAKLCHICM